MPDLAEHMRNSLQHGSLGLRGRAAFVGAMRTDPVLQQGAHERLAELRRVTAVRPRACYLTERDAALLEQAIREIG